MDDQDWTEAHARTIAEAAPPVPEATELELARTWRSVRADLSTAPPKRWKRGALGAGLAAATLAIGGVAVADVFSAHTGRYPSDTEAVELGGPGEYLDPAAPDYGEVIAAATTDIPFPSTQSRQIALDGLVADGARDEPGTGSVSTGAVRGWVAQGALCAWADTWAAAIAAGDGATRAHAQAIIDDASSWPAVTDLDPVQRMNPRTTKVIDPRTGKSTTLTYSDNTVFGYLPLVQDAARGDDVSAMGDVLRESSFCYPGLTPDLPGARPSAG